jgi:hypothetical protein
VHRPPEHTGNPRRRRLRTLSGLALLLLLGHLTLMASPLHAAMLGVPELSSSQVGGSELQAAAGQAQLQVVGSPHVGHHCAVEWSSPAKPILCLPSGSSASWSWLAAELDRKLPVPSRYALGPPQQLDLQTLLQVFRI